MTTIRLERSRPIGYLIINEQDGREILVQTDWDYPSTAGSFGWSIRDVQPRRCAVCGEEEASAPWTETHKYGPVEHGQFQPCDHAETDGTIDCASCGLEAGAMIEAAASWMDENEGATAADDSGYFSADEIQVLSEAETADSGRIGG